jgi:hypothetical protein
VSRLRLALAASAAALALSSTPAVAAPANEANDFPFPGADTIALQDGSGHYATFGASARGRKVPNAVHGSGNVVGSSPTIAGDAMPGGGGAWAARGSGIWTPGAFYAKRGGVGRYYLFYTATKANSNGRKCVGVAVSTQPFRGYAAAPKPLACPTKGTRWAIDADVTQGPERRDVWMTWRDGQRALGAESALSAMRLKLGRRGAVRAASKPRVLLRSNALTWAHYRDGGGVTVIENPSAFYNAGSWYLFYSGNSWPTNYYATGIAYCGARLGDGLCKPMPGPKKAYFAYSGPKAHLPASMRRYGLPGNKRGPGAMDVYRASDGQPWVTWNYLSDAGGRKSRTGRLIVTGTGAAADFKVRRR